MDITLLIDTHAHLDTSDFDEDRAGTIARALDAGVGKIISVGTDLESSKKAVELSERYAGVYAAVGVHPHNTTTIEKTDITALGKIARHSRVVAIGEIGLDFYRDYSPKKTQIQALKWQLALSAELELPIIIHSRKAEKDTLELLRSSISDNTNSPRQYRGVIHCFSGDISTAKEYLNMGFYLSLGAYIGIPPQQVYTMLSGAFPRIDYWWKLIVHSCRRRAIAVKEMNRHIYPL